MRLHLKKTISDEEPNINLTPLIDVVFVILIMFIVIAPLLEMEKIALPKASPFTKELSQLKDKSLISIEVKKDNGILLNSVPVSFLDLKKRLVDLKKVHPQAVPQLFHDQKAYFGTYQEVKNALEMAGFEELELILKPA